MKITRKTAIRIRKAMVFARALFLFLFGTFLSLAVASANKESLVFFVSCFAISIVCFGISYALDRLLLEIGGN